MKKKTILVVAIALLTMSGLATAAWVLFLQESTTGFVTSTPTAISFTTSFSDWAVVDVTNTTANETVTATLTNDNGDLNFLIDLEVIKTDVDDACEDWENDTVVRLFAGNNERYDGETIFIASGETVNWHLGLSAVHMACPQNVTATLTLTEA